MYSTDAVPIFWGEVRFFDAVQLKSTKCRNRAFLLSRSGRLAASVPSEGCHAEEQAGLALSG